MASKRMFDKAIVDTDRFMDMPISAKAIYFLLGIEADDEGFVSYKKVMRIHGGSEDDINVLIAKKFVIRFPSGVVVVTDWNKNNWLDSRRMKPTEYQNEKRQLSLTDDNSYVLSSGLASIEEKRVEESSIEEKRGINTPSQQADSFFKKGSVYSDLFLQFSKDQDHSIIEREFDKFILYWTEPNKSGTKVRWQQQPTFEIKRRLLTWLSKMDNFTSKRESKIL